MTKYHCLIAALILLAIAAWPGAASAGVSCPTPEAFNLEGEVTNPTGAFAGLTPIGTPVGGPVEICNPGANGTAGVTDIDDIDVNVGGFCFSRFGNCGGVGSLVPIVSVDAANIVFDGDAFPSSGSFDVTAFSPSFNVTIPISFDLTTGTFFADGGALGTVAGDSAFVPPLAPPVITVSPNPANFPATLVDTSSTVDVTVENTGTGEDLVLGTIGLVDALDAPYSVTDDMCSGMTLPPASMCTIQLTFSPTATAVGADSFDIPSNDPANASVIVSVAGTVVAPAITVAPNPAVFTSTEVGQSSNRTVTITSSGTSDLTIGTIDPAGLDAQFAVGTDNCSGMTLAPAATCTLLLTFTPTLAGASMTSLAIPSDAFENTSVTLNIQGTGVVGTIPEISVDTTTLTFAELNVGSPAVSQAVTVTSAGNEALVINSITLGGADAADFMVADDCAASLAPDETCTITVTFDPQTGGAKAATVTIDSNADLQPMLDISISASAFSGARIGVEPASLDLGSTSDPVDIGASTTGSVTVSNSGNEDLIVSTITFSGEGSDEFTVDSEDCTATAVAPEGSCTITIAFAPQTEPDKMVQMTIASNDAAGNDTVDVAVNGFVFRGPRISAPTGTVSLTTGGSIDVGATASGTVTIDSTGTEPLTIASIVLGGTNPDQFSFTENCTAAPVDSGSSCTITVTFAPTDPGTKTAQLSISSDDVTAIAGKGGNTRGGSSTTIVTVSGTAVLPPPPPPPPRTDPPSFALADEGATGATGLWFLALGYGWMLARRRRLA